MTPEQQHLSALNVWISKWDVVIFLAICSVPFRHYVALSQCKGNINLTEMPVAGLWWQQKDALKLASTQLGPMQQPQGETLGKWSGGSRLGECKLGVNYVESTEKSHKYASLMYSCIFFPIVMERFNAAERKYFEQ